MGLHSSFSDISVGVHLPPAGLESIKPQPSGPGACYGMASVQRKILTQEQNKSLTVVKRNATMHRRVVGKLWPVPAASHHLCDLQVGSPPAWANKGVREEPRCRHSCPLPSPALRRVCHQEDRHDVGLSLTKSSLSISFVGTVFTVCSWPSLPPLTCSPPPPSFFPALSLDFKSLVYLT